MSEARSQHAGRTFTGPQRAAALLILLGEEHGAALWPEFDDAEVRKISRAMTEIGSMPGEAVDELIADFAAALGMTGGLMGSVDRAEELLTKIFPPERAAALVSDLRGSSGRMVWRRLAHVTPESLARFLENEYAQTIAVVLSKIGSDQGGRVLALLPDRLASDVVGRMLALGEVKSGALEQIEMMLHGHFFANGPRKPEPDRYEVMADRFNVFDRPTEARFLASLEERDRDAAQRIREKMFTFEDLLKLDAAGCQTLLRQMDKDTLARALKGASEAARDFFTGNMSTRAAKNLKDDIEAMGPIRMKEVDEAQSKLVQSAKALAETGEIRINKNKADDDVVV